VDGLSIHVYPIKNNFFGETVTVAGLLTGGDVCDQLCGKELGDELLFPAVMLRADEEIFLDDTTPRELSERLGVPMRAVKSDGAELIAALLGLRKD
jgi:NifB/MoaA-like Fe-S oxidoreductase